MLAEVEDLISHDNYPQAIKLLKRAISINSESKTAIKALYKLGFIQETYLKDFEGALFNYREFIRLSQDKMSLYEVQKRIAQICFEGTQDPEGAVAAYQALLSIGAESLERDFFLFRLGQSYFRLNNFEKAREQYQKVLEDFPKSSLGARVRYEIGNTYYMEGKYDIAIEALKQVVRLNAPSEYATEAQFLMAQSFEHLDKATNAFQMYQAIQDRYPAQEVLKFRMQEIEKKIKEAEKKVKKK